MKKKILLLLIGAFLYLLPAKSQLFYRIEADFTIKEKSSTGYENLMMGRVYYDKTLRNLVFKIEFPKKEVLIITDTATIATSTGEIKKHSLNENLIDFSVLHLFLNGDLEYFGLSSTPFKLTDVEKDEDLIISTWMLEEKQAASEVSKLLLSQKENKLHGLITFGAGETIFSKQIFSEYIEVNGLDFPSKVLQITYLPDGSELKKITTYKNVQLNNSSNNVFYNYKFQTAP